MIRIFDTIFAVLGIIIFSPLFFVLSIWIKLDSKGSVFYKQKRVGKGGVDFFLLKLRSMHTDSETKGLITIGSRDPRITRSGYFIRKYKLDELPQLFNVFIGDMSLVGPRPEVRKYVDLYTEQQKSILSIRPGITDYASIRFRNENELLALSDNPEKTYIDDIMPIKLKLNFKYINNPSIKNYFYIITITIKCIFKNR